MSTSIEIKALRDYARKIKKERDVLLAWYVQTLENYDGLTTGQELEREVLLELKKAIGE